MSTWPGLCFRYPQSAGINLVHIWIGLDRGAGSLIRGGLFAAGISLIPKERVSERENGSRWVNWGVNRGERVNVMEGNNQHAGGARTRAHSHTVKVSETRRRQRHVKRGEERQIDRHDCTAGFHKQRGRDVLSGAPD